MPINNGFIKLHRKLQNWEWADDPPTFCAFVHLLMMTNHEDNLWKGKLIKAGQCITSYPSLAKKTGLTSQQARRAIKNMQNTGEITVKTTNKYSLVSIIKWKQYQFDNRLQTSQNADKQQTNAHSNNTKQEYKEIKKLDTNVSNGSKSRNPFVDIVLSEFQNSFSFKPTDKKPRFVAHNFSKNIQAFLKVFNPDITEKRFTKVIRTYLDWLLTQDYANKIETLDLVRRKFSIWADPQVTSYQKGKDATNGK